MTQEVNFDGLVGPTHNYSGLSFGNLASTSHRSQESNPKEAALQGLAKMKALMDLGVAQAVLPPHERPHMPTLKMLGFEGSDAKILERVAREAPQILSAVSSASAMWTANSATVSPSADTGDRKVHFSPANLSNKFHRAIEAPVTARVFASIFKSEQFFVHHPPLQAGNFFSDEGAANHTRLAPEHGKRGIELFVFGRYAFRQGVEPQLFPARQTCEASVANARRHKLDPSRTVFAQQHPEAIDAGVFHNDVAAVGNCGLLFFHEHAFLERERTLDELSARYGALCAGDLELVEVRASEVSLADAVKSYLFNTQLVSLADGTMCLIAPTECEQTPSVKQFLEQLVASRRTSIRGVRYFNLRESMRNGGGPACLRLRVALTEAERKKCRQGVFLDDKKHERLVRWVKKHYRDRLTPAELPDPKLLRESRSALDELTEILGLGSVYDFQR